MSAKAEQKTDDTKQAGGPLIDVHTMEEIKALGWRPERQDDNTWKAIEENTDLSGETPPRELGPAKDMKALHTLVKIEIEKNGGKVDDQGQEPIENFQRDPDNPDGRLPGLEEPEIGELNNLADVCIEKLELKKQAITASKDADDVMRVCMRKHGRKRYSRRGMSIVIEDSEKLVIKKAEKGTGPKSPSTKKQ